MKNLFNILITILCLIIPAQVSANTIPIPINRTSTLEIDKEKEEKTKEVIGIYKLGQQPLILGISQADYPKIEELIKGTRVWKEDAIYSNVLDLAKRDGNILVYDKKSKKGYEISEQVFNDFLVSNNLRINSENQNDVVEIWETDKTQVINLQQIQIENDVIEPLPIDVPEYKMDQVRQELKILEEIREKPLEISKYKIIIDGIQKYVTEEEIKRILNTIETQESKILIEKLPIAIKQAYTVISFEVIPGLIILVLLFCGSIMKLSQ